MKYPGIRFGIVEAVWNKLGGERGVQQFLQGEVRIIFVGKPVINQKVLIPKTVINTLITIDRSAHILYPESVKRVLSPDLQESAPICYDMAQTYLWVHEDQKSGKGIQAIRIYELLRADDTLKDCYGYSDILAIQKNGIVAFEKVFRRRILMGLRSMAEDLGGEYCFPGLLILNNELMIKWFKGTHLCGSNMPVARFR